MWNAEFPENVRITVGQSLRKLRKARGLTLEDVASLAQCSFGYISQIELGRRGRMSVVTLLDICEALGTELSAVLNTVSSTLPAHRRDINKLIVMTRLLEEAKRAAPSTVKRARSRPDAKIRAEKLRAKLERMTPKAGNGRVRV
jgi:transcriptional regulator with XRE-family HTH domain